MSQRTSQFLALAAMIVMMVLYGLTSAGLLGPNPVGSTGNDVDPLIIPATYAFAIWGPIYLGLIVFPVYQLIKDRDNHPAWVPLRQWYAANVVANGLWLVFASYDWQILTVGVIAFMLFSLLRINLLLRRISGDGAAYNYWLERLVFSLYFAWVTLATALNVASALAFYDWDGWGFAAQSWTMTIMAVAALIAAAVAWKFRDAAYALVVVWAFVALAVRHYGEIAVLAYEAMAIAVFFLLLALRFLFFTPPVPAATAG